MKKISRIASFLMAVPMAASVALPAVMQASALVPADLTTGHTVGVSGTFNNWGNTGVADVLMNDDDGNSEWQARVSIDNVTEDMLTDGKLGFKVRLDNGWQHNWGMYNSTKKATYDGDNILVSAQAGKPLIFDVTFDNKSKTMYYTDKTYEELGDEAYMEWPVFYLLLPSELTLSKTQLTMQAGSHDTLSASIYPTDARDKTLTWKSSDPSVATVDNNGNISAISSGSADITVSTVNDIQAVCRVTVTAPAVNPILDVSPNLMKLGVGESGQLTTRLSPADSSKILSFTSSDPSVASVDSTGKVTALKAGTATITVSGSGIVSRTSTITVVSVPTSVKINKTSLKLQKGSSEKLSAAISPSDAENQSITWTSSDASVAIVDAWGSVVGIKSGKATITAETANGMKSECKVTVLGDPTGIKLSKTKLSILKGKSTTIKATVQGTDPVDTVYWYSSDTKVATVKDGKIKAVAGGKATITAKTINNKSAKCTVTVTVNPSGVKLNKTKLTIGKGDKATLKATVNPSNASSKTVKWSSSNSKVVTVKNGKITAKKVGTATITAKSSNGKKASCKVTVKEKPKSVKLSKTKLTLETGNTAKLKATIKPAKVYSTKLTWTSSNKKVVTVKNGKLTAVKAGKATITVRTANGKKATCKVTVKKPDYIQKLKDSIKKKGKSDGKGNKYIKFSDKYGTSHADVYIYWYKKSNSLGVVGDFYDTSSSQRLSNEKEKISFGLNGKTIKPKATISYTSMGTKFTYKAECNFKLNTKTLTVSQNPAWNVSETTSGRYLSMTDKQVCSGLCSEIMHYTAQKAILLAGDYAGLSRDQIGFDNLDPSAYIPRHRDS